MMSNPHLPTKMSNVSRFLLPSFLPFFSSPAIRHRAAGVRLSRLHVGTDPGELLSDPVCDIRFLRCLSVPAPVPRSGKCVLIKFQ